MSNFITNSGANNLKSRLIELIKNSEDLKFLVGFFYFSGIRELYEGLKANPEAEIKVLVGLNVDKFNFQLVEYGDSELMSDEEKINKFIDSIKKSINTNDFDTQEFYEQINFFIKQIKDDKLVIRKTFDPNHSKLYIFKLDEHQVGNKNLFITGSSNLTKPGLSTQNEFNVEIGDYGHEEAEEYFDSLWNNAVKITEFDDVKLKLLKVIQNETLVKDVTPFEAFSLILKTYLDSFETKKLSESLVNLLEAKGYTPYKYQLDAVGQALSIIEKENGVIIADVVGLGKTVVACCIAKELNKRGIILCPPGLIGDMNKKSGWKKYTEEFGLYDWDVRSLYDLENVADYLKNNTDIEVIIIDEAHRFRNQDTRGYEELRNICRSRQVVLLTATPFNNRPGDILALLKLFITPKKSSITLEENLAGQFKGFQGMFDRLAYIKKYWNSSKSDKQKKALTYFQNIFGLEKIQLKLVKEKSGDLAKQIKSVIEPVTIRRNRLDLQNNPNYKDEVKDLSVVHDPQEWFFELDPKQSSFYTEVVENYFGDQEYGGRFTGAIYRPFEYEKQITKDINEEENRQLNQQRNLFDFMRRLLVKRFESSFGAFEQSIQNFKRITERSLDFINDHGEYILDRSLLEKIYEFDEDEIETHLLEYESKIINGEYPKNHKRYKLSSFVFKDKFIYDIQSDILLYDEILEQLRKLDLIHNDPKTDCLVSNIKNELAKEPEDGEPRRKIIIFTEYVDTANYLNKTLEKIFEDKLLVVAGNLSATKIKQLNLNFDASYSGQADEFDILLATDKISEGFNLNRAGMVINYDIPWNPVRVIQRLGRINRISKKVFNKLFIVNFFPTDKGSELVQSREIASNKMFMIHSALGEDSKIFDVDEEPTPAGLYNKVQQNPEKNEGESFYTKVLNAFLEIQSNYPEVIKNLENYPPRVKVAKIYSQSELLVFFKKERLYILSVSTATEKPKVNQHSLEEILSKIECSYNEKGVNWNTDKFWEFYSTVQNYKEFNSSPGNELSLETQAFNNLESLIRGETSELAIHKNFLRNLKQDIVSYGTLADFTLRRIANLKENSITDLIDLREDLGDNYLDKQKLRISTYEKEIIIAIENKSNE